MRWMGSTSLAALGFVVLSAGTPSSAKPSASCGDALTRSTTLDADLVCGATALTIATPGVVLHCSGHAIRGTAPGGIALQVTAPNVTVVDCTIDGFSSGIMASDASGLKISRNRFSNVSSAVRADRSPRLTLADNLVESGLGFVSIRDCPDTTIERNEFRQLEGRTGSVGLQRSPRARIRGHRATGGLEISVWRESDDSVVANNALGGRGRVSVGRSSRVEVRHNSAGGPGPAHRGSIFGVELKGATDCDVTNNELSGVGIFLDPFDDIDGAFGADGNRIRENSVEQANFGILLFGGSHNVVERNVFSRNEIAVAAFPHILGGSLPTTPTTDNDVRRNRLDSGSWGVYTNAGGNRYEENQIRGFGVGITELAMAPTSLPDVIRNNVISDNGYFGLLTEGASPVVTGNEFARNGWGDQPPATLLFPYGEIFREARGGIGMLPWNGDDEAAVVDDGDPSNDIVSESVIGNSDEPNTFEDNAYADIYSLDTRAANAAEIQTSNEFRGGGESARVRQDWYGSIRVLATDGGPATGATVDIADAHGIPTAALATGPDGVAPNGCDPTRPMGRLSTEENGPTPQWLRITQYVIHRDGNRVESTPHQIDVRRGGLTGHATFAWTGCADPQCEVARRYQIVDVTLGP